MHLDVKDFLTEYGGHPIEFRDAVALLNPKTSPSEVSTVLRGLLSMMLVLRTDLIRGSLSADLYQQCVGYIQQTTHKMVMEPLTSDTDVWGISVGPDYDHVLADFRHFDQMFD